MHQNWLLTRRRVLWLGLATLTGTGAIARETTDRNQQNQGLDNPERDFKVVGKASLKERAAAKGLIYGAAANYPALSSDPKLAARFVQECAMIVPENELKWPSIRPGPDTFDFTKADWLANFAHTHGMLFRGHNLVWNQALPPWFKDTVNSKNAREVMLKHIKTVVGHYAGKIHSWDVVNEAIWPEYNQPHGLRYSPWLDLLGPDYIDIAFHAAAQADPKALLVYNGDFLEHDRPEDEKRRVATLKLLEGMKSRGTPVQALGMEAHLLGEQKLNPKKLKAFLHDVADLGLKIMITEMDVKDDKLPLDINVRDRTVAGAYEDFLSVVLDQPAVIAVLTWGLSDLNTWYKVWGARADGSPVRPLPLDAQLKRKLGWNALAYAFDHAPKR